MATGRQLVVCSVSNATGSVRTTHQVAKPLSDGEDARRNRLEEAPTDRQAGVFLLQQTRIMGRVMSESH